MYLIKPKIIFIAFIFTLVIFPARIFSQATISFQNSIHNFGNIKEVNGPVEYSFPFVNTGSDSLLLYEVKASCSCTIADWKNEPVASGGAGAIKVQIDPKGIRGDFYKTIRVLSNATNGDIKLILTGKVLPVDTTYRYDGPFFQIGNLKFSSLKLNLDTVLDTEIVYDSVLIVNMGKNPISIKVSNNLESVHSSPSKDVLNASESGYIRVSCNGTLKDIYGDFYERISVSTDDSLNPEKSFSVFGFVKEDFSLLSDNELLQAPVSFIDKEVIDFGEIRQGEKIPVEFQLSNKGKRDLLIRKIKPSCGCTVLSGNADVVKAGDSILLKFIFDSTGKKGMQNKKILLIVNDPLHPIYRLFIQGSVSE